MRGKRADWSLVSRAAGHQRGDLGRAGRWRGLYAMLSGGVRSGAERWSEQVTINTHLFLLFFADIFAVISYKSLI